AFSLLLSVMVSVLSCMPHSTSDERSSTTSSSTAGRLCPTGCVTCSALNGCLSCKSRLFFHLEVDGMRQRGVCLSSCPRGHYGTRSPYINTCTRCKEDCASCFSESFCTRCHSDHLYTLQGQCYLTCPKGFEPDEQLMQCLPQVHCEVGEWSDWSPCVHKRSMKMYRRGEKTRTRQMLSPPSRFRKPCPKLFQFRKCIFKKRQRGAPGADFLFDPLCLELGGKEERDRSTSAVIIGASSVCQTNTENHTL
uniref:R-spondin Fu-CRD domain-containing protein n=1 Tax=Periophthalmus magnuspinnatus TaxID=409849 RepID=A0A3B4A871_9GOBI